MSYIDSFPRCKFWNLSDGKGQGFIIFFIDKKSNSNQLVWASRRTKKIVKSTLIAETFLFVEAAENVFLTGHFY